MIYLVRHCSFAVRCYARFAVRRSESKNPPSRKKREKGGAPSGHYFRIDSDEFSQLKGDSRVLELCILVHVDRAPGLVTGVANIFQRAVDAFGLAGKA